MAPCCLRRHHRGGRPGACTHPIPVYRADERDGRITVEGPVDPDIPERIPPSALDSAVLVGAGAAGATAAETLRRLGLHRPGYPDRPRKQLVDRPNWSESTMAALPPGRAVAPR